jgi:5-methylcytosine-specific restriction protein A
MQRGYGSGWQKRRARQLLRHPAYQWRRAGDRTLCGRQATEVDHVRPKVYGGSDDPSNLQSLCGEHHRAKTASEGRSALSRPPRWHGARSPNASPRLGQSLTVNAVRIPSW